MSKNYNNYDNLFNNISATSSDEAGFWPVINKPSSTAYDSQSAFLLYIPPFSFSISSTKNGTTSVNWTAASSEFVKPVTFLPSTNDFPSVFFVCLKTAGAWQTAATVLLFLIKYDKYIC